VAQFTASAIPQGARPFVPVGVDLETMLMLIVAAGVVIRLSWLGIGLLKLRSIVARASGDDSLAQISDELKRSLGVEAAISISVDVEGPATVGVRRPSILLPPTVLRMSTAVQRAILCHELVHVKRRDWLQTIGEEIWRSLLWFHPHAHLVATKLSLAREMVVDEATMGMTRDRRAYAEALLAFSDPQPRMIGATPFIGRHTLSQRIALIAEEASMSTRRALAAATIALAATIGSTAIAIDRFPMFAPLHAQSVVHKPGDSVTLPEAVHEVKPEYTREAMQQQIQGTVWLLCVVSETGDVTDVAISQSLDSEYGLDQAAIDAARQWKFKPGRKDGQPVAVQVTLEMRFRLR
jgi:TonB family protein